MSVFAYATADGKFAIESDGEEFGDPLGYGARVGSRLVSCDARDVDAACAALGVVATKFPTVRPERGSDVDVGARFERTARPYQLSAARRAIAAGGRFLLSSEPGLGKPFVAAAVAEAYGGACLVLTTHVARGERWRAEFAERLGVVVANEPERPPRGAFVVVVASYRRATSDPTLRSTMWTTTIVDGAIVRSDSNVARIATEFALASPRCLFLSDDPTLSPRVWTALNAITRGGFGREYDFLARYAPTGSRLRDSTAYELSRLVEPFALGATVAAADPARKPVERRLVVAVPTGVARASLDEAADRLAAALAETPSKSNAARAAKAFAAFAKIERAVKLAAAPLATVPTVELYRDAASAEARSPFALVATSRNDESVASFRASRAPLVLATTLDVAAIVSFAPECSNFRFVETDVGDPEGRLASRRSVGVAAARPVVAEYYTTDRSDEYRGVVFDSVRTAEFR